VQNPWQAIDWPDSLATDAWCFSPELSSLWGTPEWDALDDAQRTAVLHFECVNFFSLNVHGERSLLAGIASRLYQRDFADMTSYLHHFLDEENKHMQYFGSFCQRYSKGVYPERKTRLNGDEDKAKGVEDLLFFARVLIFEMTVDHYNKAMAADERLCAVVRSINRIHHMEEARHLSFGRHVVALLAERCHSECTAQVIGDVQAHLRGYVESVWSEYYNPQVYSDAGLPGAHAMRRTAYDSQAQRHKRAAVSGPTIEFLRSLDLFPGQEGV